MAKPKDKTLDIAYFSMEVALDSDMSTYSGGLGVLAGDTLKTFADFGYTALGITLLNELGYVEQEIDSTGKQVNQPEKWNKEEHLIKLPFTVEIPFNGRSIICVVWRYDIVGQSGKTVSVYFLDSNIPRNDKYDRALTSYLYGGDSRYRLSQEQILGVGGLILLDKIGYKPGQVRIYHLNEGHASFAGLSLYEQAVKSLPARKVALDYVNSKLVFTTHTSVAAGHDRFLLADVKKSLPAHLYKALPEEALIKNELCMSRLALYFSGAVTGVARTHEKTAEKMFPGHDVIPVTNGAYHLEWVHPYFKKLYDEHIPEWRHNPSFLRQVLNIPDDKIWATHSRAKRQLMEYINTISPNKFSADVCTLGFARRVTSYKRPTLILSDLDELEEKISSVGPLQIIFAGEAHPRDKQAAELIREIFQKIQKHKGKITMVFLEDYDMAMALKLVAGVDIWLNTPLRTHEASGTSGMKAAFNAIPHLSVLDGWWPEGWIEGITGWSVGTDLTEARIDDQESWGLEVADLYHKLASTILPLYYQNRSGFIKMMKYSAALNGSYFNTYRMIREYTSKVYFLLGKHPKIKIQH
jgi:starch phosphorylase